MNDYDASMMPVDFPTRTKYIFKPWRISGAISRAIISVARGYTAGRYREN